MAILEKVVDAVPTERGKRIVDRNLMPVAGAAGTGSALFYLVGFLYDKVPAMEDVMPEGVFLSALGGLLVFIASKMDLSMTGVNWLVKGKR